MRAVIFNIDGTLLQSASVDDALYRASVTAVLGPVRFRASLSDYDFVTDSGILSQVLNDNSLQSDLIQTIEIKARFVEALTSHIREYGPFQEIPGANGTQFGDGSQAIFRVWCGDCRCLVCLSNIATSKIKKPR